MGKAKVWVLKNNFKGKAKASDIKLVEESIPDLKDGEVLVQAVYLSVDPYMRGLADALMKPGDAMVGEQVAKVIKSKNTAFKEGTLVRIECGWRSHTVVSDMSKLTPVDYLGDLSPSLALGVLGMPGATAYTALLERGNPKSGETLLVNGAAGAVGSLVGQIAKIKGCRVIGCAGTDDKCKWLKELGFDEVFNYKTADLDKTLKKMAPDGIDVYFDNVGGDFTVTAMNHMKNFGRAVIVGSISSYNSDTKPKGTLPYLDIFIKELKVEGFLIYNWREKWQAAFTEISKWIKEGKIKYKETITEGFDKMPQAFLGLFEGKNTGKSVVKV